MNELVTACLDTENVTPLMDFPSQLLSENERNLINWIFRYIERHKSVPTADYVADKFPAFVVLRAERRIPIAAIYEDTLERKLLAAISLSLNEAEEQVREAKRVPYAQIHKIMSLSLLNSGMFMYSSYDRSKYFREGDSFPLGFKILDQATGGLFAGEFGLITGRLGSKKTTVSQWIAKRWWEAGKRILYISTEMLAMDIFSRLDGMVAHFNPLMIRDKERRAETERILSLAKKKAGDVAGEIIVPSKHILNIEEVGAYAVSTLADAVVIDGLYHLRAGKKAAAKWEQVAEVSNRTKQLAMEIERPVLATTQIKRVGEKLDYDPEDIAYSDALGQDADFIIAVRPEKLDVKRAELQLIKNRFGPEVSTLVTIDFDRMQIQDILPSEESIEPAEGKLW